MPMDAKTLIALGLDKTIDAEINGRQNGVNNDPAWERQYHPCPEANISADTPRGEVRKFADWQESKIYPGTRRDIWVYHTATLTDKPQIILFNDGAWYLSRKGPVQATHVLDTLHHQGEIGSTIAVFITPGIPDHKVEGPIASYDAQNAQRSHEYDKLTPDYGNFLFQEVIPFVEQQLNVIVSNQPQHRTLCGISSGGIAAFNAAWLQPEQCQRVISHCGSFTDIWGGHNYPSLIRKTPRKPIRAFLQSGENDANTPFGNWALANQTMADALNYAGYDYRFEFGVGGHSLNHGGALFADTLRWLWR